MTSLTTLPWNLVTKNLQVDGLLCKKLRQKITKSEKHLKHFPPDTVHRLVVLERHPKKPLLAAALTCLILTPCHRTNSPRKKTSSRSFSKTCGTGRNLSVRRLYFGASPRSNNGSARRCLKRLSYEHESGFHRAGR